MDENPTESTGLVWQVGALCRAVADSLNARFNPVAVSGEVSGFARAGSGHCYFSLKDGEGQLRCAMFRRAAALLNFDLRDGQRVVLRGRLDVYGPRGDLQLIAESAELAGQGALYEQFARLKAKLQAEGLFDAARKRALPPYARGIGVVTSRDAAALRDVITALARRAPHLPVLLAPASVQGAQAPAELMGALRQLYRHAQSRAEPPVDVILLVRGGGSLEDLWAFNDESLARLIVQSPVPVVSGVGHESDFTLADFCADLRAPTPTAAAELAAPPREQSLRTLGQAQQRLRLALTRQLQHSAQRLDLAAARLGTPSALLTRQAQGLQQLALRLRQAALSKIELKKLNLSARTSIFSQSLVGGLQHRREHLERLALRLELLNPAHTLARGYAWASDANGQAVRSAATLTKDQALTLHLSDGAAGVVVRDVALEKKPR